MNIDHLGLRPKPEEEELETKKRELQDLEGRLIESELQLASLKGEIATFERLYLKIVGIRYAELDEIEAQIAELLARLAPGNIEAHDKAQQARSRADESRMGTAEVALREATRFSPSSSLKSLYREVARRIHPDLAVDDADRLKRQKLMAEANRAYEDGNEQKLRAILEQYESSPEAVSGQGTGAELVRVIRKIAQTKRRLSEIELELNELMKCDLALLKKKVDEGSQHGRDILAEMASSVNMKINEREAELSKIRERTTK
jgi:hypothetical protein